MENSRCRLHGGKTPVGLANANTKTGRYSKVLPVGLAGRYELALRDPELLSVREDVALLQARIDEHLASIAGDEAGPDYTDVVELVQEIADKWMGWDRTTMDAKLRELREAAGARRDAERLFADVRDLIGEKAKLVAQENKRMVDLGQMMTVEEGVLLAQALAEVSNREISDEAVATRSATEIRRRIFEGVRAVMQRQRRGREPSDAARAG